MKKVLVGLALALTLSACGGIQKTADTVGGSPQPVATHTLQPDSRASFVRAYVNENTSLDWSNVPDSLIDKLGNETCSFAGSDLTKTEYFALRDVTMRELGVTGDEANVVLAALLTSYCPGTTIDGRAA
jgi:hypothetical protein